MTGNHDLFLALGSNIDPETHFVRVLEVLRERIILKALSTCYKTAPIGPDGRYNLAADAPWFLNAVVQATTRMDARSLKYDLLRPLERQLGRLRSEDPYAPRTMDIDILLFDDWVVQEPDLCLPDPHIASRPFLLAGLMELAPRLVMPDTGKMIGDCAVISELDMTVAGSPMIPLHAFTRMLRERFFAQ